jgi:hypothetical protein
MAAHHWGGGLTAMVPKMALAAPAAAVGQPGTVDKAAEVARGGVRLRCGGPSVGAQVVRAQGHAVYVRTQRQNS